MTRRVRVDAELVRRGLARSREQAAALIEAGSVTVGGTVATKAESVDCISRRAAASRRLS